MIAQKGIKRKRVSLFISQMDLNCVVYGTGLLLVS